MSVLDELEQEVPKQEELIDDFNVRPGVRFIARMLDISIFSLISDFFLYFCFYSFYLNLNEFLTFIELFLWVFVETILLATWGTTPGKFFLKIRIKTNEGKKLRLLHAFRRSIKVWFFGLAMGIPLISFLTLYGAYLELDKNKITTWDKSEKITITHQQLPVYITVILTLLFLLPFIVFIIAIKVYTHTSLSNL